MHLNFHFTKWFLTIPTLRLQLLLLAIIISTTIISGLPDYITPQEKEAVDKFRGMVEKTLTRDFMRSDDYLIKWLRANKMNLNVTERKLQKTLDWRAENNIDNLLNEDWSKFQQRYPVVFDAGVDRKGNPVVYFRYGTWDVRKVVLAGETDQLQRYLIYAVLEAPLIRSYETSVAAGRNASASATTLVDNDGFSYLKGGCLRCMQFYLNYVQLYEAHYPQMYDKTLLVNTPGLFDTVLSLVRPFFSEATKNDMLVWRHDKENWSKAIDRYISIDELPTRLGGRKPY